MAKFKFGLDKVLDHRKVLEQLAQRDLAEVRAELLAEENKLLAMEREKEEAKAQRYLTSVEGGQRSADFDQINSFLKLQDIRMDRQRLVIKEVESRVEKCVEILRAKAIDSKIMERLKERRLEEFKLEQRHAEQKVTDDIVTTRFARAAGEKGK